MLTDQELLRYSRHIFLPEIDIAGQEALKRARVLILGLGGLGSPAALYLAAAGVGHLVLVDPDVVELSNLQRQVVHSTARIGLTKVDSAAQALRALNPEVALTTLPMALDEQQLRAEVEQATVVLAGTDNLPSRHAANRACVRAQIPLVSAAAIAWEAQLSVFDARQPNSPCLHCLYPEDSDTQLTCADTGVAAPLVGVMGSLMALETLKLITGAGDPQMGKVQLFDAKTSQWQMLSLQRDPNCAVCGSE
ncbi:HesA/MoeB/ThiF family protein [Salinispirillum marinum]|uniref:HesA/MoeB/ThiF family protein n=2 Tax=Saccharospirillaceae TaxID=255527 RepID=A0ABV8BFB0_9GAMM